MEINKNNYFARYYNWVYGNYPKDVCSFFWGSVIAILLGPFIIIGKPIVHQLDKSGSIDHAYGLQAVFGVLVCFFIFLFNALGNVALEEWFGYEFIYWWSKSIVAFFFGFLVFVVIIGGIGAVLYLIYLSHERYYNSTKHKPIPVIQNTKDFIGAIKGKYCTPIKWK